VHEYVASPESSDLGMQRHQPACALSAAFRKASVAPDPQGLHVGSLHGPPWRGSFLPEGSLESGGQATEPLVSSQSPTIGTDFFGAAAGAFFEQAAPRASRNAAMRATGARTPYLYPAACSANSFA
jgi:hypothetical protein